MKLWRIYKYTNTITGQSYIGQTTQNVNRRARKDGHGYPKGSPFREAIDEYDWENFEQSILRLCTTQEEADQYERYFIEKYNTIFPSGYNLESGGKINNQLHSRTKKKLHDFHEGIVLPEETKQKLADSTRDSWNNPKVREKRTKAMNEVMSTSEYKEKMSHAVKGKNTWIHGRHHYNNGVISILAYECPEGFVPGRLPFSKCN